MKRKADLQIGVTPELEYYQKDSLTLPSLQRAPGFPNYSLLTTLVRMCNRRPRLRVNHYLPLHLNFAPRHD
jgi:hypothetical protein